MSPDRVAPLEVGLLGPLTLAVDGVTIDVPGPRQRALLALLALAEGRTVTVDRLLEALWPAVALESGRRSLHSSVSRLRSQLGAAAGRLVTRPDGYRLDLTGDELDLARARSLLASARVSAVEDPDRAFATLTEARALWRGPILADLDDIHPIAAAVQDATQLRLSVVDAWIASGVRAGHADEVVGPASEGVLADPLREPAVLLLMRALAATGRVPEALQAARQFRRRLAEETGLDASPALEELQRSITAGAAGGVSPPRRGLAASGPPLVGRDAEVASLRRLLAADRLVTVVGPGGTGKTSLAFEVARGDDAAVVLPLATVTDPAAVPHVLASALDLHVTDGDVLAAAVAVVADRPLLLLVDNCEHLLDAIRDTVDVVLASCTRTRVLATSREPIGLPTERTFRLAPLALPAPGQDPRRSPSVTVFLDRAARVRPGHLQGPDELEVVADIVRRLDGLPLAIELAAGRMSTLSVHDLLGRLDRSLDLLGDGRPSSDARHRTLRATLAWSYELLSEDEQLLFRHLSVFVDGAPLATAERLAIDLQVTNDPAHALARLVDASMVEPEFTEGGTRYRMLEVVRAFGRDRLAALGELDRAERAVITWASRFGSWLGTALASDDEPKADAALRRELPNLRAAWGLARHRGDLDAAVAVASGLFDAIAYRDLVELRGWVADLAADPALLAHPSAAAVLGHAAEAAYHRGDHGSAERLATQGLNLSPDTRTAWYCHMPRSVVALARGDFAAAVTHAMQGAASSSSRDAHGIAALATAYAGDLDEARRLNDLGLADARSPSMRSWGAYVAGEIDSLAARHDDAEQRYLEAIECARASGATFLHSVATVGLLAVRGRGPQPHEALAGYRETVDYFARTGNWTHLWATLRNLAELLRRLDDPEPAAVIEAAADRAPDAPAVARAAQADAAAQAPSVTSEVTRAEVLDVARAAVERHLTSGRPVPVIT
jgi:predicted ATPase/DNA-binding SARP family transcriptional activator